MLAKIVFFSAVTAATLAVILLALVSPSPLGDDSLAISLYVQPPNPPDPPHHDASASDLRASASNAFIFHHRLAEGPRNTSRVVGRARGLVLPVEHSALAAFNIIYLTFDASGYRGSLGIEAKERWGGAGEVLAVVGGTGSFAFARGAAVFVRTAARRSDAAAAMYQIKLRLCLPERSRANPG